MKRPNFNKITIVLPNMGTASVITIPDGLVYAEKKEYPAVNYNGWSIWRYPDKTYRCFPLFSPRFAKVKSFKKAIEHIDRCNNPVTSISVLDLISPKS